MDRAGTIKAIRKSLKRRSGKPWSVTGGRGTAWGWITIDAPPSRRTMHTVKKSGAITDRPEDYEEIDGMYYDRKEVEEIREEIDDEEQTNDDEKERHEKGV